MANLSIYLFGPPRIVVDNAERHIHRRKAVALLAYLAVTQQPHSRDTLATLFWPDYEQTNARHNLRRTLSSLHRALDRNWLEIDRDTIRLRSEAEPWVDVWQFQNAQAACQQHGHAYNQVCPDCLPLLQQATELYRADFLAGFTLADSPNFDDWQSYTTSQLQSTLATTLERLIESYGGQHKHELAIDYARRWVALDPLHEPAQRQLMELYALSNQRTAALRQYEECRQILADELGVPPAPETTVLYEQIRDRTIGPDEAKPRIAVLIQRPIHNLPTQTTSFIGREEELGQIRRLLLDEPDCRLLNLVGPGGIGKTRLALAAAAQVLEHFADGAYFVSLAAVSEVDDIVPAMAAALNLTFYGQAEPKVQLLDHLQSKTLLLVVDNFEHLLDGNHLLVEILRHAAAVTLLVTSRERLNLQEEWGYDLQGLSFPATLTTEQPTHSRRLDSYSGLTLFLQRARRASATFAPSTEEMVDIVRICQLVDGMPLALELAAPWIRTVSCREIAEEIEQSLDFLTTTMRNVPARHRSLRMVFEQTWRQLSAAEQNVLQRLSVFRGGCTREAAEQVTGATLPVLSSLVDRALLRRTNTDRYELHELIRQFAETQLTANPEAVAQVQQRYCDYFVAFLEARTAAVKGHGQKKSLDEIQADLDNVRLVWRQAVAVRDTEALDRSAECLFVFYLYSSGHYEGQTAFQLAAQAFLVDSDISDQHSAPNKAAVLDNQESLAGFLLASQGYFLARTRDPVTGEALLKQALAFIRRAQQSDRRKEGFARLWLSWAVALQGRNVDAQIYVEPTLAVLAETDDRWAEGWCLLLWANSLSTTHPLEAEEIYKRGLAICRESGDRNNLGYTNQQRSLVNVELGRYKQAQQCIDEAVSIFEEVGNILGLGYALKRRGRLANCLGDYQQAIQTLQQAEAHFSAVRTEQNIVLVRIELGFAWRLQGDFVQSERLYQQALQASTASKNIHDIGSSLLGLGCLAYDRGELQQAEQYQREALTIFQRLEQAVQVAVVLGNLGQVMVASGEQRYDEARRNFQQALEIATELQLVPVVLHVCVGVAQLFAQIEPLDDAVELLALAEYHESSTFETKVKARRLLGEYVAQLPPATTQAACSSGQKLDWQHTAQRLIDDLQVAENKSRLHQVRHNLPTQATTFIGREREVTDLKQLLLDEPGCRLLNLSGPGGIGKTRLALAAAVQVADAFPDGIFFVPLAPVREVTDIVPAIAEALGFTFYENREPQEQLLGYLSQKHLLLIIDNFEHLLTGVDLLSTILAQASKVTLLTTARERLQLQEEWVYEVQGLAFPAYGAQKVVKETQIEELNNYSAVQLFLQRAHQTTATFNPSIAELSDIVRICQLVGGMPLGIELAAAWIRMLSCAEIAHEIARSIDFLTTTLRNVPERHRSLRAILHQTWERLSKREKSGLMQLSVFRGGCTREAAEAIAGITFPYLTELVDKALLRRTANGRYEFHELIRQFAAMKLDEATQTAAVHNRHLHYYMNWAEAVEQQLRVGPQVVQRYIQLEAEHDNLRAALAWALNGGEFQHGLRLVGALYDFWVGRGYLHEGYAQAERFRTHAAAATPTAERARALLTAGALAANWHNYHLAHPLLKESETIAQDLGTIGQFTLARIYIELSWTTLGLRDFAAAQRYGEEGLTLGQALDDAWICGQALVVLGAVANDQGEYAMARQHFTAALECCQSLGVSLVFGEALSSLGFLLASQGDYQNAQSHLARSMTIFDTLGDQAGKAWSLFGLGEIAAAQNQISEAEVYFQQALSIQRALNDDDHTASTLEAMGRLAQQQGDDERAHTLLQESLTLKL